MQPLRMEATVVAAWPTFAWLAVCRPGEPSLSVLHGAGLENGGEWLCEAVWDGDFAAGGFDETDIVAGSGLRLREGRALFVSSGSTVDRLQYVWRDGACYVSNSLACLLQASGGEVDASYPHYYWDFRSVVKGLSAYKRQLPSSAGPVELVYFDNLVWEGDSLRRERKPERASGFADFAAYRDFLRSSLEAVAANTAAAERRTPLAMLGTCSAGYDSPTVTVLAAEAGLQEVLAFDRGRDGEVDSGEAIAATLGVRTIRVRRDAWADEALPEVPFIAADAYGEEVHYKGAERHLAGRVLFSGYHGDKVWATSTKDARGELLRGDSSGLALTDYRLHAGFIHCPVPFWGARRVREVVAISTSPEMRPWDVGGEYNRPICRRIVESAGVARELFGVAKHATSVVLHQHDQFLTDESMRRYVAWLREHRHEWLRRRRVPPLISPVLDRAVVSAALAAGSPRVYTAPRRLASRLDELVGETSGVVGRLRAGRGGIEARAAPPSHRGERAGDGTATAAPRLAAASNLLARFEAKAMGLRMRPTYLRRFAFPWALEEAGSAYGASRSQSGNPVEGRGKPSAEPATADRFAPPS